MPYHRKRQEEQKKQYDRCIESFVADYLPGRPTVIVLPGSAGSRLDRSAKPFDQLNKGSEYLPLWLRPLAIPLPKIGWKGDMHKLGIEPSGRDKDDHVIVSNGPLHMALRSKGTGHMYNDYYKAEDFFRDEHRYNYLFFSFDWRRPLEEAVDWLDYVICQLEERTRQRHGRKFEQLTLAGHSYGGIIGKVFLEKSLQDDSRTRAARLVDKLITISTPFYGTPRFFGNLYEGMPVFNRLYSPKLALKIYGTFIGPYAVNYCSQEVFAKVKGTLGLPSYPLLDKLSGNPVDPFCESTFSRYPEWARHSGPQKDVWLKDGQRLQSMISKDLPDQLISKLFHIRSVFRPMHDTYHWDNIDGSRFEPTGDNSPVTGIGEPTGTGDGPVHKWSAAHAQTVERYGMSHIFDSHEPIEHRSLMNARSILLAIRHIIEKDRAPG